MVRFLSVSTQIEGADRSRGGSKHESGGSAARAPWKPQARRGGFVLAADPRSARYASKRNRKGPHHGDEAPRSDREDGAPPAARTRRNGRSEAAPARRPGRAAARKTIGPVPDLKEIVRAGRAGGGWRSSGELLARPLTACPGGPTRFMRTLADPDHRARPHAVRPGPRAPTRM